MPQGVVLGGRGLEGRAPLRLPPRRREGREERHAQGEKFFGSFFQERTRLLALALQQRGMEPVGVWGVEGMALEQEDGHAWC